VKKAVKKATKKDKAPERDPLIARRLPWHQSAWQRLADQRQAGRLPHALLLRGPAGVGKAGFGAFFANAMQCAEPLPGGAACGQCRPCVQFKAGSHPDFHIGEPEEGKKTIRVDQIRALIEWMVQRPHYQHGLKVLLVPEAERMNAAAANALLKTLEEPPADTLIILVSARPASLLATVRSRCQALTLAMPEPQQALAWLTDQLQVQQLPADDAADALLFCGGAPLTALQALRDEQIGPYRELLADLGGISAGRSDPVAVALRWYKKDPERLINWMLGSVQAMIRYNVGRNAAAPAEQPPLLAELRQLADGQLLQSLFGHLERLNTALGQMQAGQNPSPQLLMESLLIPWQPRPPSRRPA